MRSPENWPLIKAEDIESAIDFAIALAAVRGYEPKVLMAGMDFATICEFRMCSGKWSISLPLELQVYMKNDACILIATRQNHIRIYSVGQITNVSDYVEVTA